MASALLCRHILFVFQRKFFASCCLCYLFLAAEVCPHSQQASLVDVSLALSFGCLETNKDVKALKQNFVICKVSVFILVVHSWKISSPILYTSMRVSVTAIEVNCLGPTVKQRQLIFSEFTNA